MPNIPYEDLPLTTFPVDTDTFLSYLNVTASDGPLVLQYLDAMNSGNTTLANQLLAQIPSASQKIIRATDLNKMTQCIQAIERFYKTDVEPYIDEKQQEWLNVISRFTYLGTWNSGTSYVQNNIVSYYVGGVTLLYLATAANVPVGTPPSNTQYWRQLTVVGTQGPAGPGLSFSQSWNSSTTYPANSAVIYGGALWMAVQESTGIQPGTDESYWRLVLSLDSVTYPITDVEPTIQQQGGLWFNTQNNPTGYVRLDPLDNPASPSQVLSTYEYYNDQGVAMTGTLDVYTKDEVDQKLEDYLPLAGGTMTGAIAMSNQKITNLGAPTDDNDAVRKIDLDNVGGGAIIESLQIAYNNTITQGDVVDINSSNQVYKNVTTIANVENDLFSGNTVDSAVTKLSDQYSVAVFVGSAAANNGQAILLNNSDGSRATSTYPNVGDLGTAISNVSLARLSDTQFVVGYISGNFKTRVGTVSGTSISFGAEHSEAGSGWTSLIALSGTSFASFSNDGQGTLCQVFTVSGTTISRSSFQFLGTMQSSNGSATPLPDEPAGNHRVCVCFSDSGDGNRGKAVIATIDSSNQVTWGTVVTFSETEITTTQPLTCDSNGNNVLVCYYSAPSDYALVLSTSGTNITVNTRQIVGSTSYTYLFVKYVSNGAALLTSSGIFYIDVQGTEIIQSIRYQLNLSPAYNLSMDRISENRLIATYADGANSGHGTSTVLEVSGNQIAGGFTDINNSSTAIALQSGVEGQNIPVIYSGITQAPWVVRDQIINSPGVYGVGVTNGVLQVYAKNRPGQAVSGSYVGTGTYGSNNPNSLTFPFSPKILFITRKDPVSGGKPYMWTYISGNEYMITDYFSSGSTAWNQQYCEILTSGTTISWCSVSAVTGTTAAATQANTQNEVYTYVAFS